MAQRTHYWSCSKFADWLRGTAKPSSATSKGWKQWKKNAKANHSFRFWLAEEGLDKVQNFIWWPVDRLYDIKYYINNRWVTRTHCLSAHRNDIKPGTWRDVGNRFLPCLFNELVDFVEIEQAWHYVAWDKEARKLYNTPWYATGWFRWRTWRSPEAGLAYLNWASSLKYNDDWGIDPNHPTFGTPTPQAEAAKEIKELYLWWTTVYPNRPDPYDASGWSDLCATRRSSDPDDWLLDEDESDHERAKTGNSLDMLHEIEKQYEDEEESMLIRLIKVRHHLWT